MMLIMQNVKRLIERKSVWNEQLNTRSLHVLAVVEATS